jgi:hypothetical protein
MELLQIEDWIKSNQEKIFTYYLKIPVGTRAIKSPFRKDNNPSLAFFYSKDILLLHDFALEQFYDCVKAVSTLYKESRLKALSRINRDKEDIEKLEVTKLPAEREIKVVDFVVSTKGRHVEYFKKYGIKEETLKKFEVFDASYVYVNNKIVWRASDKNPVIVYRINDKYKCYRPLERVKAKKWLSSTTLKDVGGLPQLKKKGDMLIITSSLKDVMVLYEMGFNAICFSSEHISTRINSDSYKFNKSLLEGFSERFKTIVLLLNSDEVGINAAKQASKAFNIPYTYLNPFGPKDPSDLVDKIGFKKAKKQIKKLLTNVRNKNGV